MPSLWKALVQSIRCGLNWSKGDPESATEHGRGYLDRFLIGGIAILAVLYHYGIAVPEDFVMFTGAVILIDIFQFGTLLRLATLVDPVVGGVLGAIGLEVLTKAVRGVGVVSATVNYFVGVWS